MSSSEDSTREDNDDNDVLPYEEEDDIEVKIKTVEKEIKSLTRENEKIRERILDSDAEKSKYEKKLERLQHDNKKLEDTPLTVAVVKEIRDDGIIVKQPENNQELYTNATPELREELEPDMRVMVNQSFAIVDTLEDKTDYRTRVMQVEESPDIMYDDIGGLTEQLKEVRETVELPLSDPDKFENIGINPPSGVLLHGPPGTGKTMMAKAVANETDATFIRLAGSELVQKYVGEGARLVRDLFKLADKSSPSIIFIDELDAIASKRTGSKTSGDAEVQRTLMQLLSSMDGFDEHSNVRIIGATNRFDILDEAILRPGRFDRIIEVPEPNEEGRKEIFRIHTQDMSVSDNVELEELAEMAEGASGADIKAICTEAGMIALRDDRVGVEIADFEEAIEDVFKKEKERREQLGGFQ